MTSVELIRLLDLVITLAMRAGINIASFHAMREQSGGHLTEEQVQQLIASAKAAVEKL